MKEGLVAVAVAAAAVLLFFVAETLRPALPLLITFIYRLLTNRIV